jgi:hypothetical protein
MQQAVAEMTPIQQQVVELQEFHIRNLQDLLEQASLRQQQDDQFLGNVVLAVVEQERRRARGPDGDVHRVPNYEVTCTNSIATPVKVERDIEGDNDENGCLILTVSRMTEAEWMAEFTEDEWEGPSIDDGDESPEVAEKLAELRSMVAQADDDDAHPRGFVKDPAENG